MMKAKFEATTKAKELMEVNFVPLPIHYNLASLPIAHIDSLCSSFHLVDFD